MNERIRRLLESEQLSSSAFADIVGVQRSSISHLLAGRNKPSYDFLIKTLEAFPGLRADWLLLGEGSMYKDDFNPSESVFPGGPTGDPLNKEQEGTGKKANSGADSHTGSNDLFAQTDMFKDVNKDKRTEEESATGDTLQDKDSAASLSEKSHKKQIQRVMVFYTDHTFQSYEPE